MNLSMETSITNVNIDELQMYAHNPRIGNVEEIARSLEANGQYRPIVVRKETKEILAGNHTWLAAKKLHWKTIKVVYVEKITDEQAKRIVIADNRTSDLAIYDENALLELLQSISHDDNLEALIGTGFSESDIENLNTKLEGLTSGSLDRYNEWQGMPEYNQENKVSAYRITVHFPTDEDADKFFEMIGQEKKGIIWWPEHDGLVGYDSQQRYVTENT